MYVCSSYGSVFKAIHKESGQVVAIKQVPVESDLQEIIKEISIMQQCDRWANTALVQFFVYIRVKPSLSSLLLAVKYH